MKGSKPRTRYKTRTRVDMSRVAQGLKMPGIDTRTWVALARVDVDAGWLAGSATLLLIAFLANHIAFVNYYSILMLVLLILVTVL